MRTAAPARAAVALDVQRAVITGGSQGIGYAVAAALAERCEHLTLLARDSVRLRRAAEQLGTDWVATDVRALTPPASERLAQASLLVVCAGEMTPGRAHQLGVADYQRQMDVNFVGAVACVRAALPHMLRRGSGTIVLISSTAALLGIYGYSAYGATKAAIAHYGASLRAETAGTGVRIIVAYPPDTETPGLDRERGLRPPETDIIVGTVTALPADRVAEQLVRAIEAGRPRVTFDATTAALVAYASVLERLFSVYSAHVLRRTAAAGLSRPSARPPKARTCQETRP